MGGPRLSQKRSHKGNALDRLAKPHVVGKDSALSPRILPARHNSFVWHRPNGSEYCAKLHQLTC